MTRTLILTRHTKSSWDTVGMLDQDRPLNARGRRSARALGEWLRDKGLTPDQVLCSSARRTRETYERMGFDTAAEVTDDLYLVDANRILRVLSEASGETVLLLGHNPGIALFAAEILAAAPDHPKFDIYPTGATLVAHFDIDSWDKIAWRGGELVAFTVPRDLLDEQTDN
ncbi:SixA phosphatase family protein [Antarcticimicrobium sediminis]|uniref:Histidine phosphatase family protein n=1 Tax=Antarcticimicrobium sediminis TaxID=2546227 RepID=A0A4R5EWA2_9RHOB|nr:histidine phosphatase family protein [Antarcticimicrobium sediminis]TDE39027.1 histidine phosphatase family protein [Antarcticimicrobium sediminis]